MTDAPLRRSFLSRLGLGGAAMGFAALSGAPSAAQAVPGFRPRRHPEDAWMDQPKAAHRVVIDSASPAAGGAALLYANNNIAANKAGYGLEASELAVIVVLRHLSTPFGYNDAIWARYGAQLSDIISFRDPKTGAAPTANLYAAATPGLSNMGVTIPSLVSKGVQFAVCSSASHFMANTIAQRTKGDADAVYKDLVANLIPNGRMAPAGVIAVNRAQEYGYTLLTAI